ncbi:MAG: hypothetical protein IK955_09145 [Clostridia bacterium]|nr:hypothetical protein [Clostridia bacterium]
MKKFLSVILVGVIILSIMPIAVASGMTYYIDSISGNDENNGLTEASAWKTVNNIEALNLGPGDKVLFKSGGEYDCAITLNCSGTEDNPVVISSYGEGEKPHLNTDARDAVMKLFDCSYVTVSGFEITAHNGGGIWVDGVTKESKGVRIENCEFHDMQNYTVTCRDNYTEGPISGRAAIVIKRYGGSPYPVNDFQAINCKIYDVGNGIFFTGSQDLNKNALVKNCEFYNMDGEAVVLEGCDGALVTHCRAINCCQGVGLDENGEILYFTAAMWTHYSSNCTFSYCEIAGQKNYGDGMTVDFDHGSYNCTYEYIYSHDNMRFMCNNPAGGGNRGNTVRYCLSVNDNQGRNKIGVADGEWNFSFYNNTIINCPEFQMTRIYDSLFANNIIVFEEGQKFYYVNSEIKNSNNVFSNNCYYNTFNPAFDKDALNTLPGFVGGDDPIKAYQLAEGSPLIGAGFKVEDGCMTDFYGNKITSNNIGCYAAGGEDGELETENFFEKLVRVIRQAFRIAIVEIRKLIIDIFE